MSLRIYNYFHHYVSAKEVWGVGMKTEIPLMSGQPTGCPVQSACSLCLWRRSFLDEDKTVEKAHIISSYCITDMSCLTHRDHFSLVCPSCCNVLIRLNTTLGHSYQYFIHQFYTYIFVLIILVFSKFFYYGFWVFSISI